MKLFFLMQGRCVREMVGVDESFKRLLSEGMLTGYEPLPYYGSAEEIGWPATWERALNQIRQMQADVVFLQYFHGPIPDPTGFIQAVKALPWHPTVVSSSGDGFGRFTRRPPASLRIASRLSDLTFATQMGGVARDLVRAGAHRFTLMPNGYCPVRFHDDLNPAHHDAEFDVVMIGNQWRNMNPTHFMFYARMQRYRQVAALSKRYGKKFGLFGQGWEGVPGARGAIPYDQQVAVMRRARVVVGAFPHSAMDYYTSDRAQIAMRSGIPYVEFHMPRTERLFVDGEHWHLARSIRGMLAQCDRLLGLGDADRLALGARAAAHMVAGHSQYHRCRLMVQIIGQVRAATLAGTRPALPRFDFFAPGIPLESEWPYAALGWR
jgi:hypothetical protein